MPANIPTDQQVKGSRAESEHDPGSPGQSPGTRQSDTRGSLSSKQCAYCKATVRDDGSILHAYPCKGLDRVDINRLQYDALVTEVERLRGERNMWRAQSAAHGQAIEELQRMVASTAVETSRCHCGTYDWERDYELIRDSRLRAHYADRPCDTEKPGIFPGSEHRAYGTEPRGCPTPGACSCPAEKTSAPQIAFGSSHGDLRYWNGFIDAANLLASDGTEPVWEMAESYRASVDLHYQRIADVKTDGRHAAVTNHSAETICKRCGEPIGHQNHTFDAHEILSGKTK